MAKRPKRDPVPGSIFPRGKKGLLTIKLNGKFIATGYPNTPEGLSKARELKAEIYNSHVGIPNQPKSIKQGFEEFISTHCQNLQTKTKQGYITAFNAIFKQGQDALMLSTIEKLWEIYYRTAPVSANTKAIYLREISVFVNWCERKGYIAKQTEALRRKYRITTTQKTVRIYTDEELQKIIQTIHRHDKEFAIMVQFMLYTGMRITETLQLRWDQIQGNIIEVQNKINKNKIEIIPILSHTQSIINTLPRSREKVFRWKPSTKSRLNRQFRKYMIEAGVPPNGRSFHALRKTYSDKLFDMELPLDMIRDAMRHSHIQTTINSYREHRAKKLGNRLELAPNMQPIKINTEKP